MSSDTVTAVPARSRGFAAAVVAAVVRFWQEAKRLYLFLLPLRFSFLSLIVVAFAFMISAQGYDIIAHLAEDDPTGATPSNDGPRIGFMLGVIFLAVQVWYWSRQLLRAKAPDGRPKASEFPWITRWLPRILGVSAFLIAIASLWRVARNYGVPEPVQELKLMAGLLILGMFGFVAYTILRRRFMAGEDAATNEKDFGEMSTITKWMLGISILLSLALFTWSTFFVQSTVLIGSAAVVILAFALVIPIGSVIVWLGMRHGIPVLTFMLLWAVVISPLTDNHVVETIPANVSTRPTVAAAFDRWFERLEQQHPRAAGEKYPVIVVATEGGGIRAAYWTTAVLTSLTDTIPGFADHTFALSGVSGGALGSTVYRSLLARRGVYEAQLEDLEYTSQQGEEKSLRFAASQMLSQDALAPTLAAMTQPDLAQRFVPFPIFPDRARALEGGLENAWRTAVGRRGTDEEDDTFANGFLSMMQEDTQFRLPSLFLNGTIVETGQRIIASNLRINRDGGDGMELADAVDLFDAIGGDVRVSTAADNSMRFTYVSPAGTLLRAKNSNGGSPLSCAPGERCEHVVDGGYFENSGSATATDLLEVISRSKYASRVQPHVIFIQFEMAQEPAIEGETTGNEVLSPVRALLSARGAHADLAEEELKEDVRTPNHTTFELIQRDAVFPLGWLLADRTRNLMDVQMGPNSAENGANVRRIAAILGQQNAIRRDLVQELAAKREADPKFQE